jgi:polyisoprenoid-binding protein YceI
MAASTTYNVHPDHTHPSLEVEFANGAPKTVTGVLTLHGVSRPVTLSIYSFKRIEHPMLKKQQVCGTDASGTFNRADFGVNYGQQYGFKQDVLLRKQGKLSASASYGGSRRTLCQMSMR